MEDITRDQARSPTRTDKARRPKRFQTKSPLRYNKAKSPVRSPVRSPARNDRARSHERSKIFKLSLFNGNRFLTLDSQSDTIIDYYPRCSIRHNYRLLH